MGHFPPDGTGWYNVPCGTANDHGGDGE